MFKKLLVLSLIGGLSYSIAAAQYQPAETDNKQSETMQQEKDQPRSYDMILKDVNEGKKVTVEEAAMLVQNAQFMNAIDTNPDIADQIAKHPYASSLFYDKPDFKQWSERNPDKAKAVMDAAMKWQQMTPEDKEKFFNDHPTLKEGEGMMDGQGGMEGAQ